MNKVQHEKWCMKQTKLTSEISYPTDSCLAQLVRHWPEDLEVLVSIPTEGNFWWNFFALPCVKICQIIWQKRLSYKTQLAQLNKIIEEHQCRKWVIENMRTFSLVNGYCFWFNLTNLWGLIWGSSQLIFTKSLVKIHIIQKIWKVWTDLLLERIHCWLVIQRVYSKPRSGDDSKPISLILYRFQCNRPGASEWR